MGIYRIEHHWIEQDKIELDWKGQDRIGLDLKVWDRIGFDRRDKSMGRIYMFN